MPLALLRLRPMARKDGSPGRLAQIKETYKLTKKTDPKIGLILLGIFLAVFLPLLVIGIILGMPILLGLIGLLFGLLAAVIVFGRRAESSAYGQIEGQTGAAGAVLNSLRSGWFVTPGVAMTKNQDVVHRVIGRPGVILVSEGPANRVEGLLMREKKKTQRFIPDIEIIEIQCGDEPGQVPLKKLNRAVQKQKRTLRPPQVLEVRKRLEALGNQPVSAPKGPIPKSARAAKGPRV